MCKLIPVTEKEGITLGYKYFNGKRMVGGSAAFLHLVYGVYDGPEDYNRRIIEQTLKNVEETAKNDLLRSQFKVIK